MDCFVLRPHNDENTEIVMRKFFLVSLSFIFVLSLPAFSQKEVRKELRKGNNDYKKEKYTEAEIAYRKALEMNARSTDAAYNLGNALYKQSKFPEAMQQYEAALSREKDRGMAAADFHNVGNIFMSNKEYQKSVEAYKKALRLNPNDDETRYNLALAQKMLENQQQNQDKNKDQDKQDQNKDDQQKQDQQQQDQQQDKKDQQQQQNPNQMQKENAEQILDAMMQNERNTQEKVKAEQVRQQKQRKTDKNW
ncbi:hypothetical protein FACS189451_11810 [Bacteroidia bacterium]|nr:hypothetical protein FACS189451_11810 [Bacteroidia bacterium]